MRKTHNVPSNVNILRTDQYFISLPLKDNKIYDTIVFNEIAEITPQLIYKEGQLSFKTHNSFHLKFDGNIKNIIPGLDADKYDTYSNPIYIAVKNLPDFNACIITCDVIESEPCQESFKPILKFVSLDLKDGALNRCVCKNFENITYQKILSFEQVSVRLHFRKIGDGL